MTTMLQDAGTIGGGELAKEAAKGTRKKSGKGRKAGRTKGSKKKGK
jgi:hypothetical protein